eukprot:gnl/TRDRNA2_/TRDRNA2_157512_c0_seq4.p1 gnl/TRDRNA2_/TRDRNA2_157512_c0~~gnl/TRDRNA2_/TRDRNA2_157512_c0_seq4.p1  ORF type:complete len:308 (+),score=32.15 gnl/TRDRNA2_/TRDRNA2_157512_c0_seq4:40-963(+)
MVESVDEYHRIPANNESLRLALVMHSLKVAGTALTFASCLVLWSTITTSGFGRTSTSATRHLEDLNSIVNAKISPAINPYLKAHPQSRPWRFPSWIAHTGLLQSPGTQNTRNHRKGATRSGEEDQGHFLSNGPGHRGVRSCCYARLSTLRSATGDQSDNARDDEGKGVMPAVLPPKGEDDEVWLTFMIKRYLDDEWTKLDVHDRIGAAAGKLYREARATGENDLTFVHLQMISGLEEIWKSEGFKEAFEGPCDIANRAAEFLMLKIGREVWSYGQSNEQMNEKLRERMKLFEAEQKSSSASAEPGTK